MRGAVGMSASRLRMTEGLEIVFILLSSKEADAGGEGAALAGAESRRGVVVRGIDDAVDDVRVAATGDVVEAATQGQVVSEKMKALFELQIESEVIGEAKLARLTQEFLLIGQFAEGESGAGFGGVGDFELMNDGHFE